MARVFLPARGVLPRRKASCVTHFACVRPGLFEQAVTGKTREEVSLEVQDMSWGTFKPLLAEATVEHLVSFGLARFATLHFWFAT